MNKIALDVIQTEVIPIEDIPLEERPPIKLNVLKEGKNITVNIPQGMVGDFFSVEDNAELYIKGNEKPIIVRDSVQEIMKKFFEKSKKQYRKIKGSEILSIQMPETLIGSLQSIYVQIDGEFEEATKLFRKDSDEYVIVRGTLLETLKKLCPSIEFC